MNRRERLMATLRGESVDRPPVSFYEIDGSQDTGPGDPFNIYADPSWAPLIRLAREKTDRIVRRGVPMRGAPPSPEQQRTTFETHIDEQGRRFTTRSIRTDTRTLTERTRQDPDVNTVWHIEPRLKDLDDLRAYLSLPEPEELGEPDVAVIEAVEAEVGDGGIAMLDTGDPLCAAASLFDMAEFTVIALTEPDLFEALLDRFARELHRRTHLVADALPGRLWRVVGAEYATPPYLPPRLFERYVVPYVTPMVEAIQSTGGFARIHCHGRLSKVLDLIAATGCTGLDPIEPPPQGDVQLSYVRANYGRQMVLFGNLEASDIESLPTPQFERKIVRALTEGTAGEGRGMVLMPSACPYGRKLPPLAMRNYEKMIEVVERW
jgi:uroporphyrinogen decarboxylase-like protein